MRDESLRNSPPPVASTPEPAQVAVPATVDSGEQSDQQTAEDRVDEDEGRYLANQLSEGPGDDRQIFNFYMGLFGGPQ